MSNPSEDSALSAEPAVKFLAASGGRIAYELTGDGPLVVVVPGVGELRSAYRFVVPGLVAAEYQVASTELRGHGDSDATFDTYGDAETAGDLIALIAELGAPAVIVGNSLAGGAAVIAAAQRPDLVSGIVLVNPFVRNPPAPEGEQAPLPTLDADFWAGYWPPLYAGRRPVDFDAYFDLVIASLRRPGYEASFAQTLVADHTPAEQRLSEVSAATLVIMGAEDPDFGDPVAEATWIAERLHGEAMMIPEAGHYPHSQQPELTTESILRFLASLKA